MTNSPRRHGLFSLEQAANAAPSLAALQERIRESRRCMEQVQHLIPAGMRGQVHAGPVDGTEWCLLVGSTAASTKVRQLLPAFQQALTQKGLQISAIRIKVQTAHR